MQLPYNMFTFKSVKCNSRTASKQSGRGSNSARLTTPVSNTGDAQRSWKVVVVEADYYGNVLHFQGVESGAANIRGESQVCGSESSTRAVWVYEDTDEQWKEFIPDIQAILEEDYSFKSERSTWQQNKPYKRQHTVTFKTQPMTYLVKCGDTIELSTVVERHMKYASSRPVVTRGVNETWICVSDDEDEPNTHTGEQQVGRSPVLQMSHSPTQHTSGTNDGSAHQEYDNATISQHVTGNKPSAKRSNHTKQQDNENTIHQSTHEKTAYQSAYKHQYHHDPNTKKTESTHFNTAQHNDTPSAIRKVRTSIPDQPMEVTTCSQSRLLSGDSKIQIKASGIVSDATEHAGTHETSYYWGQSFSSQTSGHASVFKGGGSVAIPTKYMWDGSIPSVPSYWAPMDSSSVKAVVLQPSEYEYQHVEQTFLYSLNNALITVVQIERIQNQTLYRQYVTNKDIVNKANPPAIQNERHLWHSITVTLTQHGPMPITAINARGFNKSYHSSSDDAPQVYGNGIYFSVEARGAAHKTHPDVIGHRHMYWCRVLTGEYTRGRTDMVVAPVKTTGTYDLYDSVVDIVESPTVFVIFEEKHAYPEYLITFK